MLYGHAATRIMGPKRTTDLPTMSAPLQAILLSEPACGNTIPSVGDWPPTCRLFVQLSRPFRRGYAAAGDVRYHEPNDPHHHRTECLHRGGIDCLACSF